MRYNGGKRRVAKKLAALIQAQISNDAVYWEPFCGVCSVGLQVRARRKFFSDADEAVITTIKAAIAGFSFPTHVTEQDYANARLLPASNPLHGFFKYGCSFAGKPWGGFARSGGRNYAQNAANSLARYTGRFDLELFCGNYVEIIWPETPTVIYCDPPYAGTTAVGIAQHFDTEGFWRWAEMQASTTQVFVSEYAAPEGWREIFAERVTDGLIPKSGKQNVEKLFVRNK